MTKTTMIATAISIFAATSIVSTAQAQVKCGGVNACKGTSECKSAKNSCKGMNSCKGQGWVSMSKTECDAAKAKLK